MEFELLSEQAFNSNFGDFKECESFWKDINENVVDLLLSSSYSEKAGYIKHEILSGKAIRTVVGYIRKKTDLDKCPLCAGSFEESFSSVSIVDNESRICPDCGLREQMERYTGNYER